MFLQFSAHREFFFSLSIAALALAPGAARGQGGVQALAVGQPITREMAGGESHAYQIQLDAAQYARLVVTQRGVDVELRLYGPNGAKLDVADSPNGSQGPEPIAFVAELAGIYRVEAAATDKAAPKGSYEIALSEIRPATVQDRVQIAIDRLVREAELHRASRSEQDLRQAAENYRAALALWRAGSGAARKEAELLKEIANIYATIHERFRGAADKEQALATFEQSINAANDRHWEAHIRREIGRNATRWREMELSLESYQSALAVSRELNDPLGIAQALTTIGQIHADQGRVEQARAAYEEAIPFWRAANDRRGESITLRSVAITYNQTGENQKALELHLECLKLRREMNDLPGQVNTLTSLGSTYRELGEWQLALESLDEAMKISQQRNDRGDIAFTAMETGALYDRLGQPQKALNYFNQALPIFRSANIPQYEAATLNNIGKMHNLLGDKQQALNYYNQALPLMRAARNPHGEIAVTLNVARMTAEAGDAARARELVDQMMARAKEIKSVPGEAGALSLLGEISSGAGDKQQALEYHRQALQLVRAVANASGEAATLARIARVESDLGSLNDARQHIEAALGIVETLRSKIAAQELRTAYFASVQSYYDFYIDLLMRIARQEESEEGRAEQWAAALVASERSRARSLLELLAEARADLRRDVDPDLRAREQSLQHLLNSRVEGQLRLLNGPHTPAQAERAAREISRLQDQYREVQTRIRQSNPRYAALTQPRPLTLAEIQQQVLDDDTALLSYSLGAERGYAWAVTRDSITGFELPKREVVEDASRRLLALITARNEAREGETAARRRARIARADARTPRAAAALSRLVLRPVIAKLKKPRLLVVADGALQYVPFAALPLNAKGAPLLTRHEIVMLPSASTLAALRREQAGRAPAPRAVAALADPVFDEKDERFKRATTAGAAQSAAPNTKSEQAASTPPQPSDATRALKHEFGKLRIGRLPYTSVEVERILRLAPSDRSLKVVGFEATREAATDEGLGQYRVVHFATHGYFDSQRPELSGLVFSRFDEQGRPQEGLLLAGEVYGLRLPVELVVLSACETGLGKQVRGEGVIGLTRGFMYAGASRVAVSLWAVNDRATADLMGHFYHALLSGEQRQTAAEALRTAQLKLRRNPQWRAPYYWAPFTIQGEYK
ncbi:MAG: CHAT domain-containing protein [Blastocatellales bacterium]